MTAPRPVIPPTAAGEVCESCGDEFDPQEGCLCDGHTYCASCLTNCPACMADLADDYAAEFAMERDR